MRSGTFSETLYYDPDHTLKEPPDLADGDEEDEADWLPYEVPLSADTVESAQTALDELEQHYPCFEVEVTDTPTDGRFTYTVTLRSGETLPSPNDVKGFRHLLETRGLFNNENAAFRETLFVTKYGEVIPSETYYNTGPDSAIEEYIITDELLLIQDYASFLAELGTTYAELSVATSLVWDNRAGEGHVKSFTYQVSKSLTRNSAG